MSFSKEGSACIYFCVTLFSSSLNCCACKCTANEIQGCGYNNIRCASENVLETYENKHRRLVPHQFPLCIRHADGTSSFAEVVHRRREHVPSLWSCHIQYSLCHQWPIIPSVTGPMPNINIMHWDTAMACSYHFYGDYDRYGYFNFSKAWSLVRPWMLSHSIHTYWTCSAYIY